MKLRLRFQAKVLVPVFLILAALVGFLFWLVNRHFVEQLHSQAQYAIETADAAFAYHQEARTRDFKASYVNLQTDIRLRQILQRDDPQTLEFFLRELLDEFAGDAAFFTSGSDQPSTGVQRGSLPIWGALQSASTASIAQALKGDFNIATISAAGNLWEIVSVPVAVSDHTGALTFAHAMNQSLAEEIKRLTHSEIVFIAEGKAVASTQEKLEQHPALTTLIAKAFATDPEERHIEPVQIDEEHFVALARPLVGLNREQKLGYLLLYSSEKDWAQLRADQQKLAWASMASILLSCSLVWLLVRHVTRPLQLLRSGAETVGQGDLSHRVPVASQDEFGELAATFNHMTANLQVSQRELEQTVERLKTTQHQLVQTEKLAAVGEFVAGVTHELNNPLTTVVGFAELLQQGDLDEESRDAAKRIVDGANRCHHIVRGLLSFARKHRPERKLSNLNDLVENTLSFVQYEFHTSNIQIVRQLAPELPASMMDANQLQQVFLNIVNNARQAMESFRRDGRLEVATEKAGDKLRVTFSDNGPGISPENLAKIFDPFFTTKEVGKGTGLGLSLSYGIVKEHGGTINVTSKAGQGAKFIIELPVVAGEVDSKADNAKSASHLLQGEGKRILVIDDEEAILQLVQIALRRHGFTVDTTPDGEEGLRRISKMHYDLIVCDWKMPGLNGEDIFERLQANKPEVIKRLVFMSGDVVNERTQKFQRESGVPCVAKPFSLSEFGALMRKLTQQQDGKG